jgi:IclR family KDG regulon transcriptional repressor
MSSVAGGFARPAGFGRQTGPGDKNSQTATSSVKVLDKALSVLSTFFRKDDSTLKDLEQITHFNRSTIYRILKVYLKWGFLEQDPVSKRYRLSIKILEMAGSVLRKMNFLDICRPYLLQLRDQTGESAFLSTLDRDQIVVVDWEPSYFNAHIRIMVGKTVPCYSTAAGRAILAYLPSAELDALLVKMKMVRFTESTITDEATLRQSLAEVRRDGYAVSIGEYDADIVVVSAPVFDIHHRVVASCSIAALESRVKSQEQIRSYGRLVTELAQESSRKLGATVENGVNGSPMRKAGRNET